MPKTTVVNLRKEKYDVYIGRAGRGKSGDWGNYAQGQTREERIANYREYIKTRPDLLARLHELRGKRLGCFCKPLACHGDVLAELADRE